MIVAPEYKNGYPGSLKNAFDYLPAGILRRTPVGIVTVSSGGFGGLNCLAQLRLVCLAMGGVPIPVALPVSRVDEAFDEPVRLARSEAGRPGRAVHRRVDLVCAGSGGPRGWFGSSASLEKEGQGLR